MKGKRLRGVGFGIVVHALRFGVIILGLWLAPLLGITGWYAGLFVNGLCALFAIALVSHYKLWRTVGFLTATRGRTAMIVLSVPLAEALFRALPTGLVDEPPGFGFWSLTLLLVGFNEELISRGVVLERLRKDFSAISAVTLTAALFGLQHLSAFATTDRDPYDILTNVLASATYGFALAAFQYRFSWIWPLILIHATADFTSILNRTYYGDLVAAATSVAFVVYGLLVLRAGRPYTNSNTLRDPLPSVETAPSSEERVVGITRARAGSTARRTASSDDDDLEGEPAAR